MSYKVLYFLSLSNNKHKYIHSYEERIKSNKSHISYYIPLLIGYGTNSTLQYGLCIDKGITEMCRDALSYLHSCLLGYLIFSGTYTLKTTNITTQVTNE